MTSATHRVRMAKATDNAGTVDVVTAGCVAFPVTAVVARGLADVSLVVRGVEVGEGVPELVLLVGLALGVFVDAVGLGDVMALEDDVVLGDAL